MLTILTATKQKYLNIQLSHIYHKKVVPKLINDE